MLLATSDSLTGIHQCVTQFYAGTATLLQPTTKNTWRIVRASDEKILETRVRKSKGRYRFESVG